MRHGLLLIALVAVAGCRGEGDSSGNGAAASGTPAQTATLTGLYEGGEGPRRNQMCMIERDGTTRFGLVVWAREGNNSCSGEGRATREGDRLSLAMRGDETCVIPARIEGTRVTLPDSLPQGCAYYCGAGVQMTGAGFDKTGGAEEDAMRAVDLVGQPLCG